MVTITVNPGGSLRFSETGGILSCRKVEDGVITVVSLLGAWPLTVVNSNPTADVIYVYFDTNITLNATDQYFVCGSDKIQFGSTSLNSNGSRPTITIDNVSAYPGLIKNFDGTSGYNTIRICNLQMTGLRTVSLDSGNGWIGQARFGAAATGNLIVNCSTDNTLPISTLSGGIIGGFAGSGSGAQLDIVGCTSAGVIQGLAGGIIGQFAGGETGSAIVSQCSSSGQNSNGGGGIFGAYAAAVAGYVSATNCYSTGYMSGGSGGIFAPYAGRANSGPLATNGIAIATNCYSINVIGTDSGGIFGQYAYNTTTATRCYSTGQIFGGGIFGASCLGGATNCYTCGLSSVTPTSGIYAGSDNDNIVGTNNYSEANNGNNGTWSTNNAGTAGIVPGPIWLSVIADQPFIFTEIGYTPYQLNNIAIDASGNVFNTNFAGSVIAGGITAPAILPAGGTYELLNSPLPNFTVNSSTGSISVALGTTAAIYTLTVRFSINPYSVTTYTLTVDQAPAVAASTSVCCGTLQGQSNLNYAVINDVSAGNAMLAQQNNPKASYASYTDYLKTKIARAYGRR